MTISWFQAALLGLFACLSSMPGLGGTSIGNYTLGRPLVGGLVSGLILGDVKLGIICGVAMHLVVRFQLMFVRFLILGFLWQWLPFNHKDYHLILQMLLTWLNQWEHSLVQSVQFFSMVPLL